MNAPIVLILAVADNGVIGDRGTIPWRIPEDMKRFKSLTVGKPTVMGRRTWDSLAKKPLPGRTNIVITRDPSWKAEGAVVAHSLDEALTKARQERPAQIAIIGGAEIYAAALPHASRVELTQVHKEVTGDTHFPPFDLSVWQETARDENETAGGLRYSYVTLARKI